MLKTYCIHFCACVRVPVTGRTQSVERAAQARNKCSGVCQVTRALLLSIALLTVTGCATTTATKCGTTPEGDGFCVTYQVRKP